MWRRGFDYRLSNCSIGDSAHSLATHARLQVSLHCIAKFRVAKFRYFKIERGRGRERERDGEMERLGLFLFIIFWHRILKRVVVVVVVVATKTNEMTWSSCNHESLSLKFQVYETLDNEALVVVSKTRTQTLRARMTWNLNLKWKLKMLLIDHVWPLFHSKSLKFPLSSKSIPLNN